MERRGWQKNPIILQMYEATSVKEKELNHPGNEQRLQDQEQKDMPVRILLTKSSLVGNSGGISVLYHDAGWLELSNHMNGWWMVGDRFFTSSEKSQVSKGRSLE